MSKSERANKLVGKRIRFHHTDAVADVLGTFYWRQPTGDRREMERSYIQMRNELNAKFGKKLIFPSTSGLHIVVRYVADVMQRLHLISVPRKNRYDVLGDACQKS